MDNSLRKLRVGIIGLGRISTRHIGSVMLLPQADFVACCDIDKQKADAVAKQQGAKPYYDYKEMIAKENLDCVHICLPHYLHVPVSEYAISHGVAVLCEKPMSIDIESARHVVDLSEKLGVLYGVIFQCRYNDASRLVKKAVDSGKLGKILSARSILTWSRPEEYYLGSDWKGTLDKEGGGVIIDQAIHSLDLVNWLVNSKVESLECSIANRGHKKLNVEDTAEGLITFANGVKYAFYCMNNYACNEPIDIKLFCENGKVDFGYTDAVITYNDGTTEEWHDEKTANFSKDRMSYWGYKHIRQIEQFYNACLGKEPLEISGRNALSTHEIIFEIYRQGRKLCK